MTLPVLFKYCKGWITEANKIESPNFNTRPANVRINTLVIHCISLPPGEYGSDDIHRLFTNSLDRAKHPFFQEISELKVSAHFLIRRDGSLYQYVNTADRAWHAGKSMLFGEENCNDFSIGIELEGTDDSPYEEQQYRTLVKLTKTLLEVYPEITAERIVGHSDIAPGRKKDPGREFNWVYYFNALGLKKD